MSSPKLLQSYLLDGTIEGVRIIELSESSIKAFVIPRLKLNEVKNRAEINWPSLYFLINSGDNQLYIGESESFYHRVKNHDQSKDFWDMAIAIVSNTNSLEKSDVKYLESLAVEKAQATAAMQVLNRTIPARNNVHEFKVHTLEKILEDTALIAESLGFSIFASAKDADEDSVWYLSAKKSNAKAQFRGDKFVILASSIIDKSYAPSWAKAFPKALIERDELLATNGEDLGDVYKIKNNISTRSPNHAGGIVSGRSINAWIMWKNGDGKTMDEIIRRESK
jgi:hypothetical protein